jgi:hypothetical protein
MLHIDKKVHEFEGRFVAILAFKYSRGEEREGRTPRLSAGFKVAAPERSETTRAS